MSNAAFVGAVLSLATSGTPPPVSESPIDAPIVAVTVFGDRARVTRARQQASWPAGRLVLPRLPGGADPDSVRLEVRGPGVRLDWVTVNKLRPEDVPAAAAAATIAALDRLDRELTRAKAQAGLLERLLGATASASGEQSSSEDDDAAEDAASSAPARLVPTQWQRALGALDREGRRLLDSLQAANRIVAQLERQRAELDARGRALMGGGGLLVSTSLNTRGPAELRLTYEVTGPAWRPAYDVHLDPRTDQVTASLWAEVEQSTGEDWADVELTVSTAAPRAPLLPTLPAWRIGERELFVPASRASTEARHAPSPPAVEPDTTASQELRKALQRRLSTRANVTESFDMDVVESLPATNRPIAQAGGPRLTGHVYDEAGNPLKGVKIQAGGGGGSRAAYSNDEGAFTIAGLAPGRYQVQAMAPRLKTVIQPDVKVDQTQSTEVTFIMEVNTSVEEVVVMETAPLVATTRGYLKEDLPMDRLPTPPRQSARALVALLPPEPAATDSASGPLSDAAQGHQLSFQAPGRETVASGHGVRRVPLGRYQFSAKADRHLYPAVAEAAFVVAQLRGPASTYLPGGPAALSVGADPAGQANLNLVVPGQPFILPLGVDRDLRPVRRVTQQSRSQGLLRKREITRYTVVTEVTNPHPWPVRLRVHDQLPVSSDGTVEVALVEATDKPRHDQRTGDLAFSLTVAAGATRSVQFSYTLTRPRGHRLIQAGGALP